MNVQSMKLPVLLNKFLFKTLRPFLNKLRNYFLSNEIEFKLILPFLLLEKFKVLRHEFTGLLKDLKMVTKSDKSMVIDRYKIRRWKKKIMNLLRVRRKREVAKSLSAVYFDSKQCRLLVQKIINGKVHTVNSKEDLYVLIEV